MRTPFPVRAFLIGAVLSTATFGTARFSGEKGARPHLIRLAAGVEHACAITDDGTVECWGRNDFGQAGDGTFSTRTIPGIVDLPGPAVSLALGQYHSCALLGALGTVWCWGRNDSSQLGNNSRTTSPTPVAVSGLANVISLAAGTWHTCAVRVDGTVWCWGDNTLGELGTGTDSFVSATPVQTIGITTAVRVATGDKHSCALLANGSIQCWGDNTYSQLSCIGCGQQSDLPAPVQSLAGAVDVVASTIHTCARMADGSVSCWGFQDLCIVCTGAPVTVMASGGTALDLGDGFMCAVLVDGTISCHEMDTNIPPLGVPDVNNAVEIAMGGDFTCALIAGGTIRCAGANNVGQHGNGNTAASATDSVVLINGTFLGRGIAAGNQFTCARRGAGAPACWGAGAQGQLGNSSRVALSPTPVAVTAITNPIALSAGNGAHACAIDVQGRALCWGNNSNGQLGDGSVVGSTQPVVVSGAAGYVAVSAGNSDTCALTVDGLVQCWGANGRGQLGNGSLADSHIPVAVLGVSHATVVAAGNAFACALIADGTVRCWGDNTFNQLGDGGAEAFSSTAVTVPGLSNVVSITAGVSHACALASSGRVSCWGANTRGQIGNNSTQAARFPASVQLLTDVVAISAGAFFTCAVQGGGTASCWGGNDSGELAARDSLDHLTATPVIASSVVNPLTGVTTFKPLTGIAALATGTNPRLPTNEHACALLASGVIRCWGDNAQGEIGDGTTTDRPRPTVVNSFGANVDPSATLRSGRIAEVTALINCEEDNQAHIILQLEQGAASGGGQREARCEGRLVQVPMVIPAQGLSGFQAGSATAHVEAIVRSEGRIVEDTHWTRQVLLSPEH